MRVTPPPTSFHPPPLLCSALQASCPLHVYILYPIFHLAAEKVVSTGTCCGEQERAGGGGGEREREMAPKKAKAAAKPAKKPSGKPSTATTPLGGTAGASKAKPATAATAATATTPRPLTEDRALQQLQRGLRGLGGRTRVGEVLRAKEQAELQAVEEAAAAREAAYQRKRRAGDKKTKDDAKERQRARAALQDRLFTAAFDGDGDDLAKALREGADVDDTDEHGNYPVGEAAVNGQVDAVKTLVAAGADPNCTGAYGRTPLWRAAYNGHGAAISALLALGADPRVEAQSQLPEVLCSGEALDTLKAWDVSKTDTMLAAVAEARAERKEKRRREAEAASQSLEAEADAARQRHEAAQAQVRHGRCTLERRIYEYDLVCHDPAKGEEMQNIALDLVRTAEQELDAAREEAEGLEHAYLDARGRALLHAQDELDVPAPGFPLKLPQFFDVVMGDSGGFWKAGERWPLVIDVSGRASIFLRYRDTNLLNTMHPRNMEAEAIRHSIIGSLRHGKPLVIDLCDVPLLDHTKTAFDEVEPGLWDKVMSKAIKKDFASLTREADGKEYQPAAFREDVTEEFVAVVLTSSRVIEDSLLETFFPYRIVEDDD